MANRVTTKSQEGIPEDPREWKVYPRNLTARADYIVPGNPATTRPEDAVDNSFPGLEIDARNIQKYFFQGLYFEVYRSSGAKLTELYPAKEAERWLELGLKPTDIDANIYLWAIKGRTKSTEDSDNPPVISMVDKAGLYAWKKANALYSGKTAVVIGPDVAQKDPLDSALVVLDALWLAGGGEVRRDTTGKLEWAVFVGDRASYLTDEGVLDPDVYQPGELTRTLCTPWTFDFRDCQCFYWASNKPDVVSSEDGQYEYLNFQRKNRNVEPQTEDIAYSYQARRQREIDYGEMMTSWEELRPVLNGREFGDTYHPPVAPTGPVLSLQEIIDEVTYLATVEHALAVQYLYAFYSVDASIEKPANSVVKEFRLWQANTELFNIAIDEMRHFRWANEVLKLLGASTTAKRASMLGRNFKVPFYLQSLSSPQLQWFIDVERTSRSTVSGLDGMYVGVMRSLQKLTDVDVENENRNRAVEIVKLILDEGEGHYERFSIVQQNLAFFDDAGRGDLPKYVRAGGWIEPSNNPVVPFSTLYGAPVVAVAGSEASLLQQQSNGLYQILIILLSIGYAIDDTTISGQAIRKAISIMFRLNAVNLKLAAGGNTPLFDLPHNWEQEPTVNSIADANKMLEKAKAIFASSELGDIDKLQKGLKSAGAHSEGIEEVLDYYGKIISRGAVSD